MTPADLIAFEADIAAEFNAGNIRAPVHLYDGNEQMMIDIFQHVKPIDYVCCSWRSHYQCLLKGVPADRLKKDIMNGKSISLCYPEFGIISSAIVGGIIPIAVGLGMAIKREGGDETVWCFMGDMTAETGIAHECEKYVWNWGLPVRFIIEDNRKSVCSDTRAVWNNNGPAKRRLNDLFYEYETKWPHAGAGQRVQF